jgi:hypothetical protein
MIFLFVYFFVIFLFKFLVCPYINIFFLSHIYAPSHIFLKRNFKHVCIIKLKMFFNFTIFFLYFIFGFYFFIVIYFV